MPLFAQSRVDRRRVESHPSEIQPVRIRSEYVPYVGFVRVLRFKKKKRTRPDEAGSFDLYLQRRLLT